MRRRLRPDKPEQADPSTPVNKSQTDLKKKEYAKADQAKETAHTLPGTPTKPISRKPKARVAKPRHTGDPKLNQAQLDALGLQLAGLPVAAKDRQIMAKMLVEHLNIKDVDRFFKNVNEVNIPTPKT